MIVSLKIQLSNSVVYMLECNYIECAFIQLDRFSKVSWQVLLTFETFNCHCPSSLNHPAVGFNINFIIST